MQNINILLESDLPLGKYRDISELIKICGISNEKQIQSIASGKLTNNLCNFKKQSNH